MNQPITLAIKRINRQLNEVLSLQVTGKIGTHRFWINCKTGQRASNNFEGNLEKEVPINRGKEG